MSTRPRGDVKPGLSRRSVLSAGVLGGAATLLSACGGTRLGPSVPGSGAPLVIGTNIELTGHNQVIGRAQWNALNIIVDKINANGFVAGGRTRRIQLLKPYDNLSTPKSAATGMQALVDNPNVSAVIGGAAADTALALAPLAEKHRVPLISMASASAITTPVKSHQYVFRLGANAADVARILVNVIKRKGHGRVLVVSSDDVHGADGRAQMSIALARAGLTELGPMHNLVSPIAAFVGDLVKGSSPSNTVVKEAFDYNPDAIVVWSLAPLSGLTARALRFSNVTAPLFFDSGAASAETLSATNNSGVTGGVLVSPMILGGAPIAVTTPSAAARVDFYSSYTSRYQVFDGLAPYGGDAINLVVQAVIQSGSVDRESLREAIEQTSTYEGLAGNYTFGPSYHGGMSPDALGLFEINAAGWTPFS